MNRRALVLAGLLLTAFLVSPWVTSPPDLDDSSPPGPGPGPPAPVLKPATPKLANASPGHLSYPALRQKLEDWARLSPGLAEVGSYGKTAKGQEIFYFRLTNLLSLDQGAPRKKALVTACIHGNEPLSTSVTVAALGKLLVSYGVEPEATQLVDTLDLYIVPVVSPDSYPSSRWVDGVDPNRDFPGPSRPGHASTPSIRAIQSFFLQQKFSAAISGHTHGRVYLSPFGDSTTRCPDDARYQEVVGRMQKLSGYRHQRACEMYNSPIFGSEVDWYYRNGAFAIVCEYGTHQRIPTRQDTEDELRRTYKATLLFLREGSSKPVTPLFGSLHVPLQARRYVLGCPS